VKHWLLGLGSWALDRATAIAIWWHQLWDGSVATGGRDHGPVRSCIAENTHTRWCKQSAFAGVNWMSGRHVLTQPQFRFRFYGHFCTDKGKETKIRISF